MLRLLLVLAVILTSSLAAHPGFAENSVSVDQQKIGGTFRANNNLYTGLKVDTSMDFSTGSAGANFGMYSIARGTGDGGPWGVHDIVGVHGTAIKNGQFWAAGMHCDVYDTVSGGTSICLNVEFPQTQTGTYTIGINMQPDVNARGLVGIQMQNFKSFKTAIDMRNANWIFGDTDMVPFGMRYNPDRQSLEFFRAIGWVDETKVGEVKMDFGQARPADKW